MIRKNSKPNWSTKNLFNEPSKNEEESSQNELDELPSTFLIVYIENCLYSIRKLIEAMYVIDDEYIRYRNSQITTTSSKKSNDGLSSLEN